VGAGAGGSAGNAGGGVGAVSGSAGSTSEAGEPAAGGEATGPGLYLEAESAEFSSDPTVPDGGFATITDPTASGGHYILPPAALVSGEEMHGSALATYNFNLEKDGDYFIWGRLWTADITSNRFWFQVDGGDWHIWRLTVGTIWYWHKFHIDQMYDSPLHFTFTAGPHQLVIANYVPGARLDKLYITSEPNDTPPGNTTKCHPPHTIDLGHPTCDPSCGVQAKPNMTSSCDCASVPVADQFYAYDCTGRVCCNKPLP
jgi:hypothetical protein